MSHPASAIISDGEIRNISPVCEDKLTSTKGGQPEQNACQQTAQGDSLYNVPLKLNILIQQMMAVVGKTVWEFAKLIQLSDRQ